MFFNAVEKLKKLKEPTEIERLREIVENKDNKYSFKEMRDASEKLQKLTKEDIEKMLDCKVNLQLWVKVKEDWRNSKHLLKQHGYTEGV